MRHSRLHFPNIVLLLTFVLAAGAVIAVPPSQSARKTLLSAVERLSQATAGPLASHESLKAAGKLEEIGNRHNCIDICGQLRQPMLDAIDAYDAATTSQGDGYDPWPVSDPDIAKARLTIDEMRRKLEAAGMFTMRMPGEPPNSMQNRLDNIHDDAWGAFLNARQGKIDDARTTFERLDQRIDGIKREAPAIVEHPATKRFLAAYEKFKTDAAVFFTKSDAERGTIDADVAALASAGEKLQTWFQEIERRSGTSGTEESIMEALSELATMTEAFEKNELPLLTRQMDEFAATYGKTGNEIDQKINELKGGRADYNPSPGMLFNRMGEIIAKTKEARIDRAAYLHDDVVRTLGGIGDYSESIQVQTMQKCKTRLELASRLDPTHAKVKERLGGIDVEIASRSAFIEKEIDGRMWRGHNPSFQGPGDPDALAAECARYLKANGWEEKPPRELLAVRIVGPWANGDKNILGEYINYQLPCEAAFRMKDDKEAGKNLARVFFIAFYTQDKVYTPPFSKTGIGDNYYMRASNVGAAGGGAGPSGGWGLVSILFWLALVLVNLAAGLLAANSFLAGKLPQLAAVTKALTPLKTTVGLAAMTIGAVAFLRALVLHFAPLADLLPQAVAVVAGLLLSREHLTEVAKGMTPAGSSPAPEGAASPAATATEAGKPGINPVEAVARLGLLEPFAVHIGLACLILGVLHLFLGRFPLF